MKKTIKNLLLAVLCLALLLGALAGCGKKAPIETAPATRTVVDMKGKEVELPGTIESYCVLYSSAVPMCAMVDDNLAHMVMYPVSNYFEYWYGVMFEGINDHAVQVDKRNVTAEQILESGAQVVFWNRPAHEGLVASLEEAGVKCVNVQVSNADELLQAMHVIADSFGTEFAQSQIAKYESRFHSYLELVRERAAQIPDSEKKTVLVIGSVDTPSVGPIDSYQGYWTQLTGLINVTPVGEGEPSSTLTMEEIFDADPDIILAQGPFNRSQVTSDPQWGTVRAVKEGNLYSNPSVLDEWGMPTTEAPLQFIWILKQFYPEYAADIDTVKELIGFYKDFYDYGMSMEDAEALLSCHHFYLHEALKDME
ncbi:MAG: ABC transporter substrate-binding protein [Oscillospiraceae bacterium]|nr:ABC transporter substrate-binding protein [Oscillospiraceae bacterium]